MNASHHYITPAELTASSSFFNNDTTSVTPALKSYISQPEPLCIDPCVIFGDCEQSSPFFLPTDLGSQYGSPHVPYVSAFGCGDTSEDSTFDDSYYDTFAAEPSDIFGLPSPAMIPSMLTPAMNMMSLLPDANGLSPIPLLPALPSDGLSSSLLFSGSPAAVPTPPSLPPQTAAYRSASSIGLGTIARLRASLEAEFSCAVEDDEGGRGGVPEGELFGYATGGSTSSQPPARAHKSGRSHSFPGPSRPQVSSPRKKTRTQSCSASSPKMFARTSSRESHVGPIRTPRGRCKSLASPKGQRVPRNYQCTELVFNSEDEVVYPEPNGVNCPICDYVQKTNNVHKLQELRRHIESHFTEELKKRGLTTKCCGVPLSEAHKHEGLSLGDAEVETWRVHKAYSKDGETIEMVGGCGRVFARKDAYYRHLKNSPTCVGEKHGWWLKMISDKL